MLSVCINKQDNCLPTVCSRHHPLVSQGVDLVGPILWKRYSAKTTPQVKTFACLFVGMVTPAVHIELLSDMSTASFVKGSLAEVSDQTIDAISMSHLYHIHWHFPLPEAPHFGGLWEAGVKSMKGILSRA